MHEDFTKNLTQSLTETKADTAAMLLSAISTVREDASTLCKKTTATTYRMEIRSK
jgi:hypothetical protein